MKKITVKIARLKSIWPSKQGISIFITRPVVAAITWAFLTIELLIASLFASELRDLNQYKQLVNTNISQWPHSPIIFHLLFILILVVTIGIIVIQRIIMTRTEIDATNKIYDGISMVQEMNRTLPPPKFAYDIGRSFIELQTAIFNLVNKDEDVSENVIKETIRVVLDSINGFAKTFDEDTKFQYSTNLMIYREVEKISDQRKCLKQCIKFWPSENLANCSGILFLDKELSTSEADSGKAKPDSHIDSNMALPIYKVRKDNEEQDSRHLLPGAPRAFYKQEMIVMHSIDDLLAECEERDRVDIYKETIDQIKAYFTSTGIKSFASLPIIEETQTTKCVGVVNIHKFNVGILRSARTRGEDHLAQQANTQFYYLITPYLSLLTPLINKLANKCEFSCISGP